MKKIGKCMDKKNMGRFSIVFIVSIVLALLIEIFIFNYNDFMHPENKRYNIELTDISTKKIKHEKDVLVGKGKYEMNYNFQGDYVQQIQIEYSSNNDFQLKITANKEEGFGAYNQHLLRRNGSHYMTKLVYKPQAKVKKVNMKFNINGEMKIRSVTVINGFHMHKLRLISIFFMILIAGLFAFCDFTWLKPFENKFLVTALAFGLMFIALAPPTTYLSWDDEVHFGNIYSVLDSGKTTWSQSAIKYKSIIAFPEGNVTNDEERENLISNINGHDKFVGDVSEGASIKYNTIVYLPQAIGRKVGKMLGFNFVNQYRCIEVANLLSYIICLFFAIKITPWKKGLFFVFGLLTTNLWLATHASYDAMVTGFIVLGIAQFLRMKEKNCVDIKNILLYEGCICMACLPKAIYAPLLLLPVFLIKDYIQDKRIKVGCMIIAMIAFLAMMATFILPTISNAANGASVVGDARGAGSILPVSQFTSIFAHPIRYAYVLLHSIFSNLAYMTISTDALGSLYKAGVIPTAAYGLTLVMLLVSAFRQEEHHSFNRKERIAIMVIIFVISCLIWTAMYLAFTTVGFGAIVGVQPRYFLPLLILILLCFEYKKWNLSIASVPYEKFISVGMVFVLSMTLVMNIINAFI